VADAHDDGPVDVVLNKADLHFLADSGDLLAAPVGPGPGVHGAHPGGGGVAAHFLHRHVKIERIAVNAAHFQVLGAEFE